MAAELGGWTKTDTVRFQHTATRRWLLGDTSRSSTCHNVSTHSHPKVAAFIFSFSSLLLIVSTHSHPKVAAQGKNEKPHRFKVSTHSHPKVAAIFNRAFCPQQNSFNTQPPEGGCPGVIARHPQISLFQHTATRRWLQKYKAALDESPKVSTHSHPKVAAWLNM